MVHMAAVSAAQAVHLVKTTDLIYRRVNIAGTDGINAPLPFLMARPWRFTLSVSRPTVRRNLSVWRVKQRRRLLGVLSGKLGNACHNGSAGSNVNAVMPAGFIINVLQAAVRQHLRCVTDRHVIALPALHAHQGVIKDALIHPAYIIDLYRAVRRSVRKAHASGNIRQLSKRLHLNGVDSLHEQLSIEVVFAENKVVIDQRIKILLVSLDSLVPYGVKLALREL